MKYKYVLKKYCDEIEKVENYDLAKADNFKGWVVHHRLEISVNGEEVRTPDDLDRLGMYYHRPYFELIFMRRTDHQTMHDLAKPRNTEEIRKKNSEGVKRAYSEGRIDVSGEKNGMYGKKPPNFIENPTKAQLRRRKNKRKRREMKRNASSL